MSDEYRLPEHAERVVRATIDSIIPTLDRSPRASESLRDELEYELDQAIRDQSFAEGCANPFRVARQLYARAKMYRSSGEHELSNEMYWLAIQLHLVSGVQRRKSRVQEMPRTGEMSGERNG